MGVKSNKMDEGEEESVKWSEGDLFVRREGGNSKWIDDPCEEKSVLKHGCLYRAFSLFSWIISSTLLVVIVYLLLSIIKTKHGNQHGKPVYSKLSSESTTGGNAMCVPCEGNEFLGNANISSLSERLCCTNSQSLNTLMKLLVGQSKENPSSELMEDRPIINAGSEIDNFTVATSGLYSAYFHLIIRVPANYKSAECSVNISVLDKTNSPVLSQGVHLEKPLPTGGYENVILFETVRLLEGTYHLHVDVSDEQLLYRYPGSTGVTLYKI